MPNGQSLELIDYLKAEEIIAAFCLVGRRIPGNEEIVQRLDRDGHLMINHGETHQAPHLMTEEEFLSDLQAFDVTMAKALNLSNWSSSYYRPPGGRWSKRTAKLVKESGRTLMPITFFAWDVLPFPSREKLILKWLLSNMRRNDGRVFLLHEAVVPLRGEKLPAPPRNGRGWILPLLKKFVDQARAEGFRFETPASIGIA